MSKQWCLLSQKQKNDFRKDGYSWRDDTDSFVFIDDLTVKLDAVRLFPESAETIEDLNRLLVEEEYPGVPLTLLLNAHVRFPDEDIRSASRVPEPQWNVTSADIPLLEKIVPRYPAWKVQNHWELSTPNSPRLGREGHSFVLVSDGLYMRSDRNEIGYRLYFNPEVVAKLRSEKSKRDRKSSGGRRYNDRSSLFSAHGYSSLGQWETSYKNIRDLALSYVRQITKNYPDVYVRYLDNKSDPQSMILFLQLLIGKRRLKQVLGKNAEEIRKLLEISLEKQTKVMQYHNRMQIAIADELVWLVLHKPPLFPQYMHYWKQPLKEKEVAAPADESTAASDSTASPDRIREDIPAGTGVAPGNS